MNFFFENLALRSPLASALLFIFALTKAIYNLYFIKNSLKTSGKVIEIDSSNDGDTPIVEFQTPEGKKIKFRVTTKLGKERWDMGTVWPVRYLASAPERAQIDTPHYRWIPVGLFCFAAIFVYLMGFILRSTII